MNATSFRWFSSRNLRSTTFLCPTLNFSAHREGNKSEPAMSFAPCSRHEGECVTCRAIKMAKIELRCLNPQQL